MRRKTTLLAVMACAISAWTAFVMPASAQILLIGHHGAEASRAIPNAPRSNFAAGLRDHLGFPANSAAQASDGQPSAPPVARYLVESTTSFTLDTSGPQPLLRYSNSTEVWALHSQRAPRGDTLYVNDAGEPMLRATRLGGLTAFTPDEPQGLPASFAGSAQKIVALPDIRSGAQVILRMAQSSDHLSRMAGHAIGFTAGDPGDPDLRPEGLPLLVDTVGVAMDAFERALSPKFSKKKSVISDLDEVHIKEGVPPDAYVKDDKLFLIISPARGVAGRPSSQRIFKVLMR